MKTTDRNLKKIFTALISALDDGITILSEKKEIIIINDAAIHILTNKLFSLSGNELRIKKNSTYTQEEIFRISIKNITKYFELYPSASNIIVSANAKDDQGYLTILYRKVLRVEETNNTYYIIIIKDG